jgi:hypothetical protein
VALGLADANTAQVLELSLIEEMLDDFPEPPPQGPPLAEACRYLREILELIAVRNANALPMSGACIRCEPMPEHLARDCVCRRARTFLEAHDREKF